MTLDAPCSRPAPAPPFDPHPKGVGACARHMRARPPSGAPSSPGPTDTGRRGLVSRPDAGREFQRLKMCASTLNPTSSPPFSAPASLFLENISRCPTLCWSAGGIITIALVAAGACVTRHVPRIKWFVLRIVTPRSGPLPIGSGILPADLL
eukprot:CAMPEP_0179412780 /NCGR_PEP_ID=MMETSP0799-20121207/4674_1 /TAXON_ID=46947 /ORGANISM="Geminigera cryophila, Strain CCMP2564" /LENGTH=150 /DNA_ID=CAMNT_0021185061 /DNA_START=46 /DNA_END=496 /DNA_ORIENTATION=+